jgi:hypothetical protein
MGLKKYEQAKALKKAAEEAPERFGDLVEQMDRTGNVNAAHKEMKRRQDEKADADERRQTLLGISEKGLLSRRPPNMQDYLPTVSPFPSGVSLIICQNGRKSKMDSPTIFEAPPTVYAWSRIQ